MGSHNTNISNNVIMTIKTHKSRILIITTGILLLACVKAPRLAADVVQASGKTQVILTPPAPTGDQAVKSLEWIIASSERATYEILITYSSAGPNHVSIDCSGQTLDSDLDGSEGISKKTKNIGLLTLSGAGEAIFSLRIASEDDSFVIHSITLIPQLPPLRPLSKRVHPDLVIMPIDPGLIISPSS